jgi:hypothetical protein
MLTSTNAEMLMLVPSSPFWKVTKDSQLWPLLGSGPLQFSFL